MAVQPILEQEVILGQWDITAQHNALQEAMVTDSLPAHVLKDTVKKHEPGLRAYGFTGNGYWIGGDDLVGEVLFEQQRVRNLPMTLPLTDGSVGSQCRMVRGHIADYMMGGVHGQLVEISWSLASMDVPLRGFVLHNAQASGNTTGTAVQMGAVGATEFLYGVLHVFSGSGTFDVTIESDDAMGFSTPTTQITFTTVATGTPATYLWATPVAGAITDTWWRTSSTNPATRDWVVGAAIA